MRAVSGCHKMNGVLMHKETWVDQQGKVVWTQGGLHRPRRPSPLSTKEFDAVRDLISGTVTKEIEGFTVVFVAPFQRFKWMKGVYDAEKSVKCRGSVFLLENGIQVISEFMGFMGEAITIIVDSEGHWLLCDDQALKRLPKRFAFFKKWTDYDDGEGLIRLHFEKVFPKGEVQL